jgi:hypothetical protein
VLREVAAFLLDHDGFASVEPTMLISSSRPADDCGIDPALRGARVRRRRAGPIAVLGGAVHRVGILDVCLLNIDRHAGNILLKNLASRQSACGRGASYVHSQKQIEGVAV